MPRSERPDSSNRRTQRVWSLVGRDDRLPIDPDLSPDDPARPARAHRPAKGASRRRDLRVLLGIGVGGFVGTVARYEVSRSWPAAIGSFPTATFVINTSGAFALGALLAWMLERRDPSRYLRPFLCVGVLGSWTTMSTLVTEADVLLKDGRIAQGLLYVSATLIAGIVASTAGIAIGRLGATQR